jgi:hypothetical protein
VFRPVFRTSDGVVEAGTAFAVAWRGRHVLLSALHLLGPAGGLSRDVPAAAVPKVVAQVELDPCFEGTEQPKQTFPAQAINIPSAQPLGNISSGAGDVIAFWMPVSSAFPALPLADKTPPTGARVWLAASVESGAPEGAHLHPAQVIEVDQAGDLLYAFDESGLELRATSGAPLLDAQGRVVAIHLGGGSPQGKLLGVGNPISRFRKYLEQAPAPK